MRHSPCSGHPVKPPQHEGVLLPRIVCHERLPPAKLCSEIRLSPVPECAPAPLCLAQLQADGGLMQPRCEAQTDRCGHMRLCLKVPVQAQLCDGCGRAYAACGTLETEALLPHRFGSGGGCVLFVQPHVHLLSACNTCQRDVFRVEASVVLDVYLLRMEPCMGRPAPPACPQIPLYPPPMC